MSAPAKLDSGDRHFMRLIARDAGEDGWTRVSKAVFPLVDKMPKELVDLEKFGPEGWGRARLTEEGESVLAAMEWLQ